MTEQRQIYFSSNNKINKNLSSNKIDKSNESMISQTKFIEEHAVRFNFVKYFKILKNIFQILCQAVNTERKSRHRW